MAKKFQQTYVTKNDIAYNVLKEQILDGKLLPGERIIAMQAAEQFGVSVMPIREALKRLQQEGLVTFTPHVGAKVAKFDDHKYCEITQIRNILEPYAAKLATEYLTTDDLSKLQQIIDQMEICVNQMDRKSYSELNTEFHTYIYEHCNNSTLLETINSLWERSRVTKNVFMLDGNRMMDSLEEHKECFRLICSRDGEAVQKAFAKHKERGFASVKAGLMRISERT